MLLVKRGLLRTRPKTKLVYVRLPRRISNLLNQFGFGPALVAGGGADLEPVAAALDDPDRIAFFEVDVWQLRKCCVAALVNGNVGGDDDGRGQRTLNVR